MIIAFTVRTTCRVFLIDHIIYSSYYRMRSYDFLSLRYLEHSQKLIIPLTVDTGNETTQFDGFIVYDIHLNCIKRSLDIPHMSKWDIFSRGELCYSSAYFMPARSFVFDSKLTTILTESVKSTDLETGEHLWTFGLDHASNITSLCGFF